MKPLPIRYRLFFGVVFGFAPDICSLCRLGCLDACVSLGESDPKFPVKNKHAFANGLAEAHRTRAQTIKIILQKTACA